MMQSCKHVALCSAGRRRAPGVGKWEKVECGALTIEGSSLSAPGGPTPVYSSCLAEQTSPPSQWAHSRLLFLPGTNQRNPENNAADRATRLYLGRDDGNCRLLLLLLNCIVSCEKIKVNTLAGCVDSNLCYQCNRGKYFKFFSFLLLFVCRICLSFCQWKDYFGVFLSLFQKLHNEKSK